MKTLIAVLDKNSVSPPPLWLMRQAGRYLPEYRELRQKVGSFWTMCMTPKFAAEISLQPIDRFDFDAAIVFSDILVVPHALNQKVWFEDGVGPRLDAFPGVASLNLDRKHWSDKLTPVYETLGQVRSKLAEDKALIGFAGGVWTLMGYMLEGRGAPSGAVARIMAANDPRGFNQLIELLCDIVAWHLGQQLKAGADAVQIFDSHAGVLSEDEFDKWVIAPTKQIVKTLRQEYPQARVIGFPRGVSRASYERYAKEVGVNALSLDTAVSLPWAVPALSGHVALQGNLDPNILVTGGAVLDAAVDAILAAARGAPFIFNLGHGVLPETPVAHVARLVAHVRGQA
jgi:uroporphyrinogen decarboxylase